jgi:outer membrane receptor protein involved in Fe transport
MKQPQLRPLVRLLGLAFGGSVLLTGLAYGQVKQETIEVTGSNIKRVDAEGVLPVLVLKREDIENSGKSTVNELLQSLTVRSGGSFNEATNAGNSFAPGTASISLRGLGVNTTLVLLNGRRMANYGFAQNINEAFVDLNSIPVSAIERIEVLKDGASAIYGSDAIAGVINIILRRDFRGLETTVGFSGTQDGGAGEQRAAVTFGAGSLATDRFNFMATVDFYKRERLNATQRSFSRTANQTGNGPGARDVRSPTGSPGYWTGGAGNVNTPFVNCPADRIVPAASLGVGGGGNVCAFDFAPQNNLLPKTERTGLFATGVFQVTPDWQAFADLSFNRNFTFREAASTPAAFSAAGHPDRPAGSTFTTVAYRFLEAGGRVNDLTTETTRAVLGLRGTAANWDIESALVWAKSQSTDKGRGYIIQERATEAFNGTLAGFVGQRYRVVDPSLNPPGMLAAIMIDPVRKGDSEMNSFDVKASRELFQMAGGPASVAVGFEHRREEVADTPDPRVALTNPARVTVSGSGGTAVAGSRSLNSAYAEFSIPFLKGWESQLAVRHDRYSDFGSATTPKVGISWRPTSSILVRGSYAEGFRAPALAELYLGESTSFPVVQDAPRCAAYRAGPLGPNDPRTLAVCGGATGNGASAQVRSIFLGNPTLNPEKSKSMNFGLVFEPMKDLNLSLEYWQIDHKNRILAPTAAFILANEALFPGAVRRNDRTADDIAANAPGALRGVSGDLVPGIVRSYFNASQQKFSGVDAEARYSFALGSMGKLDLSTIITYNKSQKRQINPGQPLVELVDTFEFPRWRNTTSATWRYGAWRTTVSFNTTPSFEDAFFVAGAPVRVGSMTTTDLNVRYSGFKNLTLNFGGLNVLNKKPPFSNLDWYGFVPSVHDSRGAVWYIRGSYKFF